MVNAGEEVAGSEFAAATAALEESLGCWESNELPPESLFDCEAGDGVAVPAAESGVPEVLT
jgi:hypothetical protein